MNHIFITALLIFNSLLLNACHTLQENKRANVSDLPQTGDHIKPGHESADDSDPHYNLKIADFRQFSGDTDSELIKFYTTVNQLPSSLLQPKADRALRKLEEDRKFFANFKPHTNDELKKQSTMKANLAAGYLDFYQKYHPLTTSKILDVHPDFRPVGTFIIDEKQFYISKVIVGEHRNIALLYTENSEGAMMARFLYKSLSDGDWRVTTALYNKSVFGKGGNRHYTQETKLVLGVTLLLEEFEKSSDKIADFTPPHDKELAYVFAIFMVNKDGFLASEKSFVAEVSEADLGSSISQVLADVVACKPGSCFSSSNVDALNVDELLAKIEAAIKNPLLTGFMPDFSHEPVMKYSFTHSLLGDAHVEIFRGTLAQRALLWHMAYDREGRVWIDRITFEDTSISSFGSADQFLNSGILTSKALEYRPQAQKIIPLYHLEKFPHPKNDEPDYYYVDISAFLDGMYPIKEFRHARNISRS